MAEVNNSYRVSVENMYSFLGRWVLVKVKKLTYLVLSILIASLFSLILNGCNTKTDLVAKVEEKTDIASKLDEFMTSYNENSSYKYSGTILVAKGNEIFLNKGYGMANYEENIPNKPNSVFAIGSITKSFTAVAIMQLQENGLLDVNDPISKYIEGNKRGDDITIHHLLTHTSGLPRDGMTSGKRHVPLDQNVSYINKWPLLFEPGEGHSYSNAGYQLLAAIIEEVSGKSYNDYIKDHIFIPLEMEKSRGGVDASYADNQAIGYQMKTKNPAQLSIFNFSGITGSGNIYSTTEDLLKYHQGIYDKKLLKAESIDKMFSPQWGDWNNGYGYGWDITKGYNQKKISHGGNIGGGGYVSSLISYPESDYVIIFLTNNADYTALNVVSTTIEAIIFGEDYVIPEKTENIKIDSETLEQYAGDYEFEEGFFITVSYKNGKLYSTADDGNLYELLPISSTSFHFEDHQWIKTEFSVDKDNSSIKLKIRNINRVFEGAKVKN